ncbi:hypothetical protein BC940DRAFT_305096 [Gongronella butleri]|nr:hypothetical protein BC940DRAFT_305096 [Gongronella butleri]
MASVALSPPNYLGFKRPLTQPIEEYLKVANTSSTTAMAFKVKTTAPKRYCVKPNSGIIEPNSSVDVQVVFQPFREEPPLDTRCKDKFMVQTASIDDEKWLQYTMPELWSLIETEHRHAMCQTKIKCTFLPPDPVIPEEEPFDVSPFGVSHSTTLPTSASVTSSAAPMMDSDMYSVTSKQQHLSATSLTATLPAIIDAAKRATDKARESATLREKDELIGVEDEKDENDGTTTKAMIMDEDLMLVDAPLPPANDINRNMDTNMDMDVDVDMDTTATTTTIPARPTSRTLSVASIPPPVPPPPAASSAMPALPLSPSTSATTNGHNNDSNRQSGPRVDSFTQHLQRQLDDARLALETLKNEKATEKANVERKQAAAAEAMTAAESRVAAAEQMAAAARDASVAAQHALKMQLDQAERDLKSAQLSLGEKTEAAAKANAALADAQVQISDLQMQLKKQEEHQLNQLNQPVTQTRDAPPPNKHETHHATLQAMQKSAAMTNSHVPMEGYPPQVVLTVASLVFVLTYLFF